MWGQKVPAPHKTQLWAQPGPGRESRSVAHCKNFSHHFDDNSMANIYLQQCHQSRLLTMSSLPHVRSKLEPTWLFCRHIWRPCRFTLKDLFSLLSDENNVQGRQVFTVCTRWHSTGGPSAAHVWVSSGAREGTPTPRGRTRTTPKDKRFLTVSRFLYSVFLEAW